MDSALQNTTNMMELLESTRKFVWLDYTVFVMMLVLCSGIGFYWGFLKKQNTMDYLIGGRQMKMFPVSMSLVASYISGIFLLGTPTEIYVYGIQYLYISGGIITSILVLVFVFLPVYHELQLTSSYEYLQRRFNRKIRFFGSFLFSIQLITWLPIVIYVPALAFNQVTGINVHIITPIVCLVCIFYTCVGGLQAVVWTDVIQTIIMFGAILIVIFKGSVDIGGLGVVWERNMKSGRMETPNWDPDPLSRHTFWSLVVGGCFHWTANIAVSQIMVQRYMALPSLRSAQRAAFCFLIGVLMLMMACCYCGMLIYATYHDCDPLTTQLARAKDQLLPLYVMDVLGDLPGLPGMFVAGVFSAALSSLSTGLNSMAAVVLEDFYKPYAKSDLSEKHTNILMKSAVLILGLLCLGLVIVVEKLGTVLQLAISLGAITSGASLGIFASGLLIPRVHSKGVLVGGVVGLVILSWICLSTQAAIARGDLTFLEKPVSTEGCKYTFTPLHTNVRIPVFKNATDVKHTDEVFMLYRLSYLWYTLLGTIITMTVSWIVSYLWDPVRPEDVDVSMAAPFLRRFYKNNVEKTKEEFDSVKLIIITKENVIR